MGSIPAVSNVFADHGYRPLFSYHAVDPVLNSGNVSAKKVVPTEVGSAVARCLFISPQGRDLINPVNQGHVNFPVEDDISPVWCY